VVKPVAIDGLARAAEAVAAGAGVSGLVSAHAVQLSEGVMRMMLVAKLKAVGAAAVTCLVLTGGLGFGLAPAIADEPGKPAAANEAKPAAKPADPNPAPNDDAQFLRRLYLDLAGTLPTTLEVRYFVADPDGTKRKKVLGWLLEDEAVKEYLAKKHTAGQPYTLKLVDAIAIGLEQGNVGLLQPRVTALAFSPDGTKLAVQETVTGQFLLGGSVNSDAGLTGSVVLTAPKVVVNEVYGTVVADGPGKIVLNERNFDIVPGTAATHLTTLYRRQAIPHNLNYTTRLVGRPGQTVEIDGDVKNVTDSWWIELLQPAQPANPAVLQQAELLYWLAAAPESDADFLRRVVKEARGSAPTGVEEKYFAEDKDPKKREKVLDLLLQDPAVAKKLGDDWKRKALAPPNANVQLWDAPRYTTTFRLHQARPLVVWDVATGKQLQPAAPDRLTKLVDDLLAAKKDDAAVLDAVTLAVLGRLATDGEKAPTLAAVSKAADRKAAWVEVAKALAATPEAKKHAAELNKPAK
jgi:hypothetical protein